MVKNHTTKIKVVTTINNTVFRGFFIYFGSFYWFFWC